jgi:CRP-like cAMP-binding protein
VPTFDAGDVLVRQGAESDDVYLLLEGTADVDIDGQRVATLGPKDLVGERGVVTGTPRAATVTAASHTAALVLSRTRFAELVEANPSIRPTMVAVTGTRYPTVPAG